MAAATAAAAAAAAALPAETLGGLDALSAAAAAKLAPLSPAKQPPPRSAIPARLVPAASSASGHAPASPNGELPSPGDEATLERRASVFAASLLEAPASAAVSHTDPAEALATSMLYRDTLLDTLARLPSNWNNAITAATRSKALTEKGESRALAAAADGADVPAGAPLASLLLSGAAAGGKKKVWSALSAAMLTQT